MAPRDALTDVRVNVPSRSGERKKHSSASPVTSTSRQARSIHMHGRAVTKHTTTPRRSTICAGVIAGWRPGASGE
jgi:hypothetical protein